MPTSIYTASLDDFLQEMKYSIVLMSISLPIAIFL